MQSTDWPDQHSKMLCELHAQGRSYAEIARALNAQFGTAYTRNATLGRGKRIGLVTPGGPKAARSAPRPMSAAIRTGRRSAEAAMARPIPAPSKPAAPVQLRCVGISPRLLSLDRLEANDCHYPYGGERDGDPITFCGHPRQPGSCYCTPHYHLTRLPPEETVVRPAGPLILRLVAAA
ncbi:GcrA family cell cycle regulator [Bradyrhizobium sp. SRS-191]|uniref:GcrA family cell cycle regulator n=1 Tax=Bradyrhizobium sp. SRS-191 TaxID=2962606 RepID=UPI00211EBEC1|nr:GcrA family cell cycle regulator [Bradyrhizobium sp. SRS-191]